MDKKNILIYSENGFFYGSVEKLLLLFAKTLSRDFNVFFLYGENEKSVLHPPQIDSITFLPFKFKRKQGREPYRLEDMEPGITHVVHKYGIHCMYVCVYAYYQFPIHSVPASIPLVLISPFGHYATNGTVYKTYVSGKENKRRIEKRGVRNVELLFNPKEDFPSEYLRKDPVGQTVLFGRVGRGEDANFDPISVKAFKKLEDTYGDTVRYIVVNASPGWKKLAGDLGIRNMEYRENLSEQELSKFYQEIDVFAHARKDGETVGMAIAEAMMAGNPVLTHKSHFHNDHFDILSEQYARWCEPDDDEQYFKNMVWMVEHKAELRGMGQLARKRSLEIFSIEYQAPGIIRTFQEACLLYRHDTRRGRLWGWVVLYWNIVKVMPFFAGKMLTYWFPSLYSSLRRFHER